MTEALEVATQLIAAASLTGLAIFLLALRFSSRVHRAFAAYLVFLALNAMMAALDHLALDHEASIWSGYWETMQTHALLALAPAAAHFYFVYHGPRSALLRRSLSGLAIAGGVAAQLWYMADRCAEYCGEGQLGPLEILTGGAPTWVGLVGLLLVMGIGTPSRPATHGRTLVGAALLVNAGFDGVYFVSRFLAIGWDGYFAAVHPAPWAVVALVGRVGGLAMCGAAVVHLARSSNREAPVAWQRAATLLALCAVVSFALLVAFRNAHYAADNVISGAWRLGSAFIVAYALAKYRLFDIDVKVRKGVVRGSLALFLLFVFLIVSKMVELTLGEGLGPVFGGVAAGLAVFAMTPLEHAAKGLAQVVWPERHKRHLSAQERQHIYFEQAVVAWEAGRLGLPERRLLDGLRRQLELDPEIAMSLEEKAARLGAP